MRRFLSIVQFPLVLAMCVALVVAVFVVSIASATTFTSSVKASDGTVVGEVSITDGDGMTGGFTSTFGEPPSQAAAAEKCGEDHFNWLQIVLESNVLPPLPDGTIPTPPFIDPPSGGYGYGWADDKPWYWDEGDDPPDPKPENWEDGYNVNDHLKDTNDDGATDTLEFRDFPSGPSGSEVIFVTALASINANGTLHSLHGGFAWSYVNPGKEEGSWDGDAANNIFPSSSSSGNCMLTSTLASGMSYYYARSLLGLVPGDATLDGIVDEQDAYIAACHWGDSDPSLEFITWTECDFNFDGEVNATDASIMAANWSGSIPLSDILPAVPEPGTMLLLFSGMLCTMAIRRR